VKIELIRWPARLLDYDDFAHFVVSAPAEYSRADIEASLQRSTAGYVTDDCAMMGPRR
jgi:hypothetical protein